MPVYKRLLVYNWTNELSFLAVVLGFVAAHLGGAYLNKRLALGWMASQLSTLREQFFQVGFDSKVTNAADESKLPWTSYLKKLGPIDYVFYATGRLNIASLHGRFALKTRHNIIMLIFDYVFSFLATSPLPSDKLELTVTPAATYDNFIFAVVHKDSMKRVRETNYDISLTRTTDSAKLPVCFTVMSEAAEVTDTFFTPALLAALANAQNVLEYLVLSDLPSERPSKPDDLLTSKKRAVLVLRVASSEQDKAATQALIGAFLGLLDVAVIKAHFRPEVSRKLKAVREEEVRKLKKMAEEERAEELAKQRAQEKKAQKQSISKLSPEEQKKALQKEREKELRKQQKKMTRRN
ncbi:uncharacterized protein V2V93DRAFT_319174 [Kockiozyma suomiensis]|uniref:uncharacterized protein n=1 Tax=Kockiozyma suomiensis TaxID=1337062 RepID=UPI003344368E